MKENAKALIDFKIDIKLRLAALWTTLMFLYIYADYFELMVPGKIENVMNLRTPVGETTPTLLVVFSIILIIPALMPFLSVFLKATINKWTNIIIGFLWSTMSIILVIVNIGDIGGWYTFYTLYKVIEVFIFTMIVWSAWKWPKIETK